MGFEYLDTASLQSPGFSFTLPAVQIGCFRFTASVSRLHVL